MAKVEGVNLFTATRKAERVTKGVKELPAAAFLVGGYSWMDALDARESLRENEVVTTEVRGHLAPTPRQAHAVSSMIDELICLHRYLGRNGMQRRYRATWWEQYEAHKVMYADPPQNARILSYHIHILNQLDAHAIGDPTYSLSLRQSYSSSSSRGHLTWISPTR